MRLTPLLPVIALLGLTACDQNKLAALTGAKPAATAVCTPSPVPNCAPAPGVMPTAMAPEVEKPGPMITTGQATVERSYAAPPPEPAPRARASRAATHHYTRHTVRRAHAPKARKVVVVRKNYYIHNTRYVQVDRPVYQPPQVVYVPQPQQPVYVQTHRPAIYVDREIDRTSTAYGRQVYNRYARSPGPAVVYRQEHRAYSGGRQEQYSYEQRSSGHRYNSGYQQGYRGEANDCNCEGAPAAGRDRSGYLTWPGKTEARNY